MVEHFSDPLTCNSCLTGKTSILNMAPKRSDTMADMVIAKCVSKQVAECLVPLLSLVWCTHPIVL